MSARPKNKCLHCDLPTYAKHLCRRHYKKLNALKNGTYKKIYEKKKNDPAYMEKKKMWDQLYREKKKLGIDTTRPTNSDALINQDWKEYHKKWRESNEEYKKYIALKSKTKYNDYRFKAIEHYSNGKNCCAKCSMEDIRVLDLDHINDNGKSHRDSLKGTTIVYWVTMNKYPEGFQVLCKNCNWIKELDRRKALFEKNNF